MKTFTQTEPFRSMVFLFVHGYIGKWSDKVSDLVPECIYLLSLIYSGRSFAVNSFPDEVNKTIDIILFKDVVAESFC